MNDTPASEPSPAKVRVLIVDDERLARSGLRRMLDSDSELEVVSECANGADAITALRATRVDLVLLDVQMRNIDGFGVIDAVGAEAMPVIVFVTAFNAHAVRAFDACALDYVLKPIREERLRQALVRAKRAVRERRFGMLTSELQALVAALQPNVASARVSAAPTVGESASLKNPTERIQIQTGTARSYIKLEEIDYIDSDDYYTRLWVGGRQHLLREPLHSLAKRLDPTQFFRVHRSAIVNLSRVRETRAVGIARYVVVLTDGTRVPLSRNAKALLHEALKRVK